MIGGLKIIKIALIYFFILLFIFYLFFTPSISKGEYYSGIVKPTCSFEFENSVDLNKCYIFKVLKIGLPNPDTFANKSYD